MSAASQEFHEVEDSLRPQTRELHRALVSLQEELEAIDWYRQRADACQDEELREILLHNMCEEIEHATMVLEWLRRHDSNFDVQLRAYLFTDKVITDVEASETESSKHNVNAQEVKEPILDRENSALAEVNIPILTVGSLKEKRS
jgi:ferritin-like protein